MRVLVLVKATDGSEAGEHPESWTSAMMEAMGKFNDELRDAGIFVMAAGLEPSSVGKRLLCGDAERQEVEGPFFPASDIVAGFWIWEVPSMDVAMAWARRCPDPMPTPSWIEIRPMH